MTIRECASVHRAVGEGNETRIGNNVLMMAYTHVAHNCIVGNNVIMSNVATLAGHVIVEDRAVIGGLTAVHQFTKIGRNWYCGGMSRINQDVPPFVIVAGNPPVVAGLNSVGISRAGIAMPVRRELKRLIRFFINVAFPCQMLLPLMEQELDSYEEVEHFMRFLRSVERGVFAVHPSPTGGSDSMMEKTLGVLAGVGHLPVDVVRGAKQAATAPSLSPLCPKPMKISQRKPTSFMQSISAKLGKSSAPSKMKGSAKSP